jgi:hypothetical protein
MIRETLNPFKTLKLDEVIGVSSTQNRWVKSFKFYLGSTTMAIHG